MIFVFFNLVGPNFLLSAEKRTERSIVYGLSTVTMYLGMFIVNNERWENTINMGFADFASFITQNIVYTILRCMNLMI